VPVQISRTGRAAAIAVGPAPPRRRRLAPLVTVAALLGAAGCASSGAVPRPFPGAPVPPGAEAAPAAEPPAAGVAILPVPLLATALRFQGVPYRNGGSDPSGFDCSGFVQYVFAQHGLALPREVRDQYRAGVAVDRQAVEPGDLVFFQTVSRGASHVGIALGDGAFVHAPSSRGVVRVERYTTSYWATRWVGARRLPAVTVAE
jgi:cell wall-associated NlpC family hydrolase